MVEEPELSEKSEEEKAFQLHLLKDEAERAALHLQLIRGVGLKILAKFKEDVMQFRTDGRQWIEVEYASFQKSIVILKEYIQGRIESGESLNCRLLLPDNEPFCVSQEVVFAPERLLKLHPFDQVLDETPRPENDYFDNLLKLVDLVSPHFAGVC
ncbi:unnamed protein product [Hydatigera taeniaeformis]|uniref:Uncharacterized protein n=1 Tax=Hydatigena taeniaeformis TaxID=6205 RepID=A0A3P7F392_HYDTA|nr:unnamed protein product [Hydatigera taeniaeformis]